MNFLYNSNKYILYKIYKFIRAFYIGLSDGTMAVPVLDGTYFLDSPNSYAFGRGDDRCQIDGSYHNFDWPEGAIRPRWNVEKAGDVLGCGLLLGADNKMSIFLLPMAF